MYVYYRLVDKVFFPFMYILVKCMELLTGCLIASLQFYVNTSICYKLFQIINCRQLESNLQCLHFQNSRKKYSSCKKLEKSDFMSLGPTTKYNLKVGPL